MRSKSLTSSPVRELMSATEDLPRQRSSQSITSHACERCSMPLSALTPRQRRSFHDHICRSLAHIYEHASEEGGAVKKSSFLASLRKSPLRSSGSIVELLMTRRDSLPLNVIAHTLFSLHSYDAELAYIEHCLGNDNDDLASMLRPYFIERLRHIGINVVFDESVSTYSRLAFADEPSSTLHNVVDAFDDLEYERSTRYAYYRQERMRHTSSRRSGPPSLVDLCDFYYAGSSVSGVSFNNLAALGALPRVMNAAFFPCLEELHAASCALTRLADEACYFESLRVLRLEDNRLSALPNAASHLVSLESVSIARNELTELPAAIVQSWRRLLTLNVFGNRLRSLPSIELAALPRLKQLNAGGNALGDFPRALQSSESLVLVSLIQNSPRFETNEFSRADAQRGSILVISRPRCFI